MNFSSIEKPLLWGMKILLWAVPVLPLYISRTMLFPFITGKNFAFRIMVEIAFVLWVALAAGGAAYRPRMTVLFKAVTAFVAVIFLADLFAPNAGRAFFSNYERMEGFMMLAHLYMYFVMLVSVFKTKRDWLTFFFVTIGTSALVSYIALRQKMGLRVSLQGGFRVDSTIGNPTYLAAYLLVHIWMLLLMVQRFWKHWWMRMALGSVLAFELVILYFTATRGAILAFVLTGVLVSVALAIWWRRVFPALAGHRAWAVGLVVAAVAIPLFFWSVRGTDFVQESPALQRLTNFSLGDGTIRARFMIWDMAWRGFLDRPILGWGQENFYLVFQKYYNPGLFADEPWFDRAHNIFFDWLISGGALGLIGYLSMLGAVFWTVQKGVRRMSIALWEGIVLGGLFLSYFLQNMFVFDNLNTYMLFFAIIAYVYYAASRREDGNEIDIKRVDGTGSITKVVAVGSIAAAVFLFALFPLHVRPIREAKALIRALVISQQSDVPVDDVIAAYQIALDYDTFGNTEVREQLANFARGIPGSNRFSDEGTAKFMAFAIDEFKKETERRAPDVKHYLFLGSLQNRALQINPAYAVEAEQALRSGVELSPTKQIVYFELAQLYLASSEFDRAIEVLEQAWDLDRNYTDAAVNLLLAGFFANQLDVVSRVQQELELSRLGEEQLVRLGAAYRQFEQFDSALIVYERLTVLRPLNPLYHAAFGALLANAGRVDEARKAADEARRLDPELISGAREFLEIIDQ